MGGAAGGKPRVVVLDYGSGNLRSAVRAVERAGADVTLTDDFEAAQEADGLLVPGVGAYAACMAGLRAVQGPRVIGRSRRLVLLTGLSFWRTGHLRPEGAVRAVAVLVLGNIGLRAEIGLVAGGAVFVEGFWTPGFASAERREHAVTFGYRVGIGFDYGMLELGVYWREVGRDADSTLRTLSVSGGVELP